MKNVLRNWKSKLSMKNWWNLSLRDGGLTNLYFVNSILFFLIAIFNMIDQYLKGQSYLGRWYFTLIFLAASVLILTKMKHIIYNLFDYIFCIIFVLTSPMGDISAISFLFLIVFDIKNTKKLTITATVIILSLCISLIINDWSLQNTFAIFSLYALMCFKYYYIIHKPTQELKAQLQFKDSVIDNLQNRLSVIGPRKKITDSEIIDKYRFLKYNRTDKDGNDDPYRKLRIIRMLSDGYEYKEVCSELSIKDLNTLARTLKGIRNELSNRFDWEIKNNTQLVKECIRLGIIRVDITP